MFQGKSSAILLYGASKTGKTYTIEVSYSHRAKDLTVTQEVLQCVVNDAMPSRVFALAQGVGAVGGHKEGLVPRAVALLHHLVQTSQHKGSLTVTQSGEHDKAYTSTATVGIMLHLRLSTVPKRLHPCFLHIMSAG